MDYLYIISSPGPIFQYLLTGPRSCLATDAGLTADSGVRSSIPAQSHTFVEIDRGIISTVIILPSTEWERSGSVVECMTRDRRVAGLSLTGVIALWYLSKTHLS